MSQNIKADGPQFLAPIDPHAEVKDEPVVGIADVGAPHDYTSLFSARP